MTADDQHCPKPNKLSHVDGIRLSRTEHEGLNQSSICHARKAAALTAFLRALVQTDELH